MTIVAVQHGVYEILYLLTLLQKNVVIFSAALETAAMPLERKPYGTSNQLLCYVSATKIVNYFYVFYKTEFCKKIY